MLKVALRSLLARKLRLILSGLAIILGVSFVSGAFVLTDTMKGLFDDLFTDINKRTAVTVQGTSALGDGQGDREPVPQAVLDRVRQLPGVKEAQGGVFGFAQVVDEKGKAYTTGGAPSFGVSMDADSVQESLIVREGRAPRGPAEIAIDATTSRRAHIDVGDRIKVLLKGPARQVTVVGIVGLETASSFGGASLIAFEPATAQRVLGTPGTWSTVVVAADDGVTHDELEERIEKVLPKGFEAITQEQAIDEQSKELKEGLSGFNTFLLAFAFISLFVGAFLIFNTFAMLIAQRAKELALMRALGASRGQVTRAVLVEALAVGLLSSLVGFGLGILVAIGIRKVLDAVGIELPAGDTVVLPRTFLVSLLVGVVVTVAAALVPARRAAGVAPVQAMRESGPAEERSLRRRVVVGGLVLGAGLVALFTGLQGTGDATLQLVGAGAALSFLGVAILSPLFARPVIAFVGAPLARLGTPSRLGRGNAMRSPRRTSATAAALMIGLALVAMVSTLAASVKKSLGDYVDRSLGADFVLYTDQFSPFSPELPEALAAKEEVDQVAAFRFARAKVNGDTVDLQGVAAGPLEATLKVQTVRGDLGGLDRGQLAISEDIAKDRKLDVGDTVTVTWSRTGEMTMRVGAVYAQNLFAGNYLVGEKVHDANVTEKLVSVVAITLSDGTDTDEGRKAVDAAAADYPNVNVRDQGELVADQRQQIDGALNFLTGLLVLSVLIAVLGIVNTLALSVVERTRELGLLRAVGLGRRQVRRMIRSESVLIAIYGAILGIVIGLGFAAALQSALEEEGIDQFAVPYDRLAWLLVAAAVAGVIAAAIPARRAARLNVLSAIAEE